MVIPKTIFRNCTQLGVGGLTGWAINQVTVKYIIPEDKMEVTYFTLEGFHRTEKYDIPKTPEGLISVLKKHCGAEIIEKQIHPRNFIIYP